MDGTYIIVCAIQTLKQSVIYMKKTTMFLCCFIVLLLGLLLIFLRRDEQPINKSEDNAVDQTIINQQETSSKETVPVVQETSCPTEMAEVPLETDAEQHNEDYTSDELEGEEIIIEDWTLPEQTQSNTHNQTNQAGNDDYLNMGETDWE